MQLSSLPSSPAVRVGDLVFASGQAGVDPAGQTVPGGFEPQARQAFANLGASLAGAGSSLAHVVKVTIYVTDRADLAAELATVVALRQEHFVEPYPADTLVQVPGLARPEWLISLDAIALARVGG